MTIRSDVSIDWNRSPRIIFVDEPSAQMAAQDLLDTCRDFEDKPANIDDEHLVNASGKENLGGGVRVGITLELQDSIVAFKQRVSSDESGTATTADSNGEILIDSTAQFVTNGIEPGATVINFTDQSVATVIEVISETELEHYTLEDGTDNEWGIGDVYKIFNVDQCELLGGNVVAVDAVGAEASPIMPTAFTQIVRTSSSSATLQEQDAIQYASYGGGVSVDMSSPYDGTDWPVGTPQYPVNNTPDALAIISAKGLPGVLFIFGDITLNSGTDFEEVSFYGEAKTKSVITIESSADVEECEFFDCEVTGILDGGNVVKNCLVHNLNYVNGFVEQCILETGVITLGGGMEAHFMDCKDGTIGTAAPIINMGGSGQGLSMRNYVGSIKLINKTGSEKVKISLSGGTVELDSTVTNGDITVEGIGRVINNSSANVDTTYLNNPLITADAVWAHASGIFIKDIEGGRWKIENNQMIFYKDDNSTEVARFDLFDKDGLPAEENVYERRRVTSTTTTTTTTSTSTTSTTTT